MDLHKGMKSTKNTKYAANHIKRLIFIHIFIKEFTVRDNKNKMWSL